MCISRHALVSLAASAMLAAAPTIKAEVLQKTMSIGSTTVSYELVLPNNYDAGKAYPGVLGFSGGPQTLTTVQRSVSSVYADEAQKRGYIVVVPAAPDGELFFEGGERIFPAFLKQILAQYRIVGGKFHIMGNSNGGTSAFYIASLYPQYFISITAFPGFLPDTSAAGLEAIAKMCIHMFVGQNDELGFEVPMQQNLAAFRRRGLSVTYSVEAGQPHRLATLTGAQAARLFDQFDEDSKQSCGK
jgi:predicted peptidase